MIEADYNYHGCPKQEEESKLSQSNEVMSNTRVCCVFFFLITIMEDLTAICELCSSFGPHHNTSAAQRHLRGSIYSHNNRGGNRQSQEVWDSGCHGYRDSQGLGIKGVGHTVSGPNSGWREEERLVCNPEHEPQKTNEYVSLLVFVSWHMSCFSLRLASPTAPALEHSDCKHPFELAPDTPYL